MDLIFITLNGGQIGVNPSKWCWWLVRNQGKSFVTPPMCRRKSLLCSAWENDGTYSQLGKFSKEHDECFWCNMTECWFWISGIIPSYTGYAGLYILYIYNTFFLCIWDCIGDFSLCFWRETENGIPVFDLLVKNKKQQGFLWSSQSFICSSQPILLDYHREILPLFDVNILQIVSTDW